MDATNTHSGGTLVSLAMELQALDTETFEIQDYAEYEGLMGAGKTAPVSQGGDGNHATSTSSTSTCSTCSTTSCCA